MLFFALLAFVLLLFFHILLLNVSYSCELNDKTNDCFVFMEVRKICGRIPLIATPRQFSRNGTVEAVEVVCYLVFNFGLALGAGYGTFQFSLFVLNMPTSGLLILKEANTINKLRSMITIFLLAASLASLVTTVGDQIPSLSHSLSVSDGLQIITFLFTGIWFLWAVP